MTFSDSRISKFLQENFIVQWEAVSPVRLVKFDLGEGRSFSGTVNGEIAIYFCDSNGKVFDILPALQSPAVTLKRIKAAHAFYTANVGKFPDEAVKQDLIWGYKQRGWIPSEKDIAERISSAKTNSPKQKTLFQLTKYSPPTPHTVHEAAVRQFHRKYLIKAAGERYDTLSKQGIKVVKHPERIPASFAYPESQKGEKKRDAYIAAAVDSASRDLRIMVMSKSGPPPTYFDGGRFAQESLTVVEPGGLGYYQWQIARAFLGSIDPPKPKKGEDAPPIFFGFSKKLNTPEDWKETIFTTIMKQELKGGVVEYNSESLEAIQVIE